jgi:hypothetical protein
MENETSRVNRVENNHITQGVVSCDQGCQQDVPNTRYVTLFFLLSLHTGTLKKASQQKTHGIMIA